MAFWGRLLSLSVMHLRFPRAITCIRSLFCLMAGSLPIYQWKDRQLLSVLGITTLQIFTHKCVCVHLRILIFSSYHNKASCSGWLQQRNLFSPGPGGRTDQCVDRVSSFCGLSPWLVDGGHFPGFSWDLSCICWSPNLSQDRIDFGLGLTLWTSL